MCHPSENSRRPSKAWLAFTALILALFVFFLKFSAFIIVTSVFSAIISAVTQWMANLWQGAIHIEYLKHAFPFAVTFTLVCYFFKKIGLKALTQPFRILYALAIIASIFAQVGVWVGLLPSPIF